MGFLFYICSMNQITIQHPKFGSLVEKSFSDDTQFKLFLKLVHSCIELSEDLTTFNGKDFLVHVPNNLLRECIVLGGSMKPQLSEYMLETMTKEGN